jgi:hypothetical protein
MSATDDAEPYVPADPTASPFKLLVDPTFRSRLHSALFDLLENHHQELAKHVSEGFLEIDSYTEYVELFARHLRDTMNTREGVAYLLNACGFSVPAESVNLAREARWKVRR